LFTKANPHKEEIWIKLINQIIGKNITAIENRKLIYDIVKENYSSTNMVSELNSADKLWNHIREKHIIT